MAGCGPTVCPAVRRTVGDASGHHPAGCERIPGLVFGTSTGFAGFFQDGHQFHGQLSLCLALERAAQTIDFFERSPNLGFIGNRAEGNL